MNELIEVRCPFKNMDKIRKMQVRCNKLCVKVNPGSSGEARCSSCRLQFMFEVDSQSNHRTRVTLEKESRV